MQCTYCTVVQSKAKFKRFIIPCCFQSLCVFSPESFDEKIKLIYEECKGKCTKACHLME